MARRPVLHVVAGPNGAGKTTLYELWIRRAHPEAEFVNADQLAQKRFGHPARTLKESQTGQRLAEDRRRELMAQGKSLVTESTFSHPSKLDLMRDARALGYELRVYHVNVRSVELSVARVAQRVQQGGHPVPEDKIRERYVRNQELIRDAVRMAEKARVFDNSKLGQPHTLAIEFRNGVAVRLGKNVPAWARELYAPDLARFTPEQVNDAAASFKRSEALAVERVGKGTRTYIARPGGRYAGEIVGETALHTVQRIGPRSAVAHFKRTLDRLPAVGETVTIAYGAERGASAGVRAREERPRPVAVASKEQRVERVMAQLEQAAQVLTPERGRGDALDKSLAAIRDGHHGTVRAMLEREPRVLAHFEKKLQRLEPELKRAGPGRDHER